MAYLEPGKTNWVLKLITITSNNDEVMLKNRANYLASCRDSSASRDSSINAETVSTRAGLCTAVCFAAVMCFWDVMGSNVNRDLIVRQGLFWKCCETMLVPSALFAHLL